MEDKYSLLSRIKYTLGLVEIRGYENMDRMMGVIRAIDALIEGLKKEDEEHKKELERERNMYTNVFENVNVQEAIENDQTDDE